MTHSGPAETSAEPPDIEGRISVHRRGFGFVAYERDGESRSAFVPARLLRPFVRQDLVRGWLESPSSGRPAVARLELVERFRRTLFGEVAEADEGFQLAVDAEMSNRPWPIRETEVGELQAGESIVARLDSDAVVAVRRVPPDARDLERIRARYEIQEGFGAPVLQQAEDLASAELDAASVGRRDLTELTTLTVDAPTSKDLDDALSALPADSEGAIRVFVHIADAAEMVVAGTELDIEAQARGTSVYMAGAVSPMLPRCLSEGQLSLLPDAVRAAITIELRIDAEGSVRSVDLYASTIRSDRRLSYRDVEALFQAGHAELPDGVLATLRWLRTAASRLAASRAARGGLRIDRTEMHIEIDEEDSTIKIKARVEDEAHLLIERLMVAANEAVAQWLVDRGLPGVFRVHDAPRESQIRSLERSARKLGFEVGLGTSLSPRGLAALESQVSDTPVEAVMREVMGKLLGPARYTPDSGSHFGLGSPLYLHFTSPIRRYADLQVHRIVRRYLAGERTLDEEANGLHELCDRLNDAARRAKKAEQERTRMLTARWAEQHIGEHFAAHVVSVKPYGLIVALDQIGVTGAVPSEALGGSWEVQGHALRGEGNASWEIGDAIEVVVEEVDSHRGRIDFRPTRVPPRTGAET